MGWTFEYAELRLAEDELTSAEQAAIVTLANQSYAHAELDVHPQHCQVCRNSIIVTAALRSGLPQDVAFGLLSVITAEESVIAFMPKPAVALKTRAATPDLPAPDDEFVAAGV